VHRSPDIRWPAVWEHIYDGIARERAAAEAAAAEAGRRAAPQKSPFERQLDLINEWPERGRQDGAFLARVSVREPQTDRGAIAARRADDLRANHARAQQQVEDLEAELRRLEQEHAEIVRPDARLWWGIGILVVFTIWGIVVPVWIMSGGPRNLGPVHWVLYPFVACLAALLAYIVVYLAQLTRHKRG
jgi:hypothetical protein